MSGWITIAPNTSTMEGFGVSETTMVRSRTTGYSMPSPGDTTPGMTAPTGGAFFNARSACLRPLIPERTVESLEIGVGTGRFARLLRIPHGIDPSLPMLRIARDRGVRAVRGVGEALPYRDGAFQTILLATTLEFVADPHAVFREAHRTLRPGGRLVVGIINREGAWGREYREEGERGDPVFSRARFWTTGELMALGEGTGFPVLAVRSTLFGAPGVVAKLDIADGEVPGAGFIAVAMGKHWTKGVPA